MVVPGPLIEVLISGYEALQTRVGCAFGECKCAVLVEEIINEHEGHRKHFEVPASRLFLLLLGEKLTLMSKRYFRFVQEGCCSCSAVGAERCLHRRRGN